MKKTVILMLAFVAMATVSCSSDDGGGEKTQSSIEMLIENGDWNFQSAEVLEIHVNSDPPRSMGEITTILNSEMPGMVFKFFEDGAGSFTVPTGESEAFPYTVEYLDGKIRTISVAGTELNNVVVSEGSLKFTWHIDWQVNEENNNSGDWVSVSARMSFEH